VAIGSRCGNTLTYDRMSGSVYCNCRIVDAPQKDAFLKSIPEEGVLRKFLSKEEIALASYLVKTGELGKGVSDDRQKSVIFYKSR
jgi:hypothetical protein